MLELPLFDEEHRAFCAGLERWLATVPVRENEADAAQSCRDWVGALAGGGWLRACVPGAYGGIRAELDVRTLCLARERLAYHSALADFAFAMQGLGGGPVALFGNASLKKRYLPEIAAGRCIAAFALSELEAGSDVAALATTATRRDGEYVLDGRKTWISNAGIADLYIVFARTGERGARGLSAFAVDATAAGVRAEGSIETISPHPLGTLELERVVVSESARIGAEGEGFKVAMSVLDVFRSTVGAAANGFARRALDESVAHVKRRQLFGAPLSALQLTQAALATMATDLDAATLLVYRAAWSKDSGRARVTREAAMAKWFATEAAGRICDRAVQLFGGRGVTRGEIVERLYRDVRALRIYEGASEIQQIVIAKAVLEG
ncbi:MAG TPA: acyl-CoA dehydrogenase family protein [Candidatus Cybelea sp.]